MIDTNNLTIGTEFIYRCRNNSFKPVRGIITNIVDNNYSITYHFTDYLGQSYNHVVSKDFFLNTGHYQSTITELINKKQPNFIVDPQFESLYV